MHTHNATLYPMLAVGAFMAMFWTGVVVGHALGLGCFALFVTGLLGACLGTIGVCELERRDRHGGVEPRAPGARPAPARARPHAPSPAAGAVAGSGERLVREPC